MVSRQSIDGQRSKEMSEMDDMRDQLRSGLEVAKAGIETQELWHYIKSVTERLLVLSENTQMPEEERIELIKAEIADITQLLKDDMEAHGFEMPDD